MAERSTPMEACYFLDMPLTCQTLLRRLADRLGWVMASLEKVLASSSGASAILRRHWGGMADFRLYSMTTSDQTNTCSIYQACLSAVRRFARRQMAYVREEVVVV